MNATHAETADNARRGASGGDPPAAPAHNASPLVELRNATRDYRAPDGGTVHALPPVSASARPGRLTVIQGRSGSGKTTALSIAAGLLAPTSGAVTWDGQDVTKLRESSRTARRRTFLGFVFQDAGLIPTLTAAENVGLAKAGRLTKDERTRVRELLARVGVEARSRNFPHQLSGGEAQRVALARSLFNNPPVLLLDEPTAGLDRATADDLIELLRHLAADGHALLTASHDHNLIDAAHQTVNLD